MGMGGKYGKKQLEKSWEERIDVIFF